MNKKVGEKIPLLKSIENNALTFEQLKNMVGLQQSNKCRWIMYDDLKNFESMSDLFKNMDGIVILLQIESVNAPRVGHFILLLDHGSHYEHFDSYGLNIDQELRITQEHHLTNLFRMADKRLVSNATRLQTFREDINTCGRWVVARYLLKKLELDEFIRLLKYFIREPDDLVAMMTILLPLKH